MAQRDSMIVIGAGVAGMSAGSYAQMNGYSTKIYDMHFIPGGCCTAWKRGEYLFDPCIEWMWGTGKGFFSNQIFRELGALQDKDIRDFEIFNRVQTSDGHLVCFYADADRLEAHLMELAPEDSECITEYCDGIRRMHGLDIFESLFMHPTKLAPITQRLKFGLAVLRNWSFFARAHETTISAFIQKLKSPALKEAFRYVFFVDLDFPLIPHYSTLSTLWKKNCGFPAGGSLGVALSMAKRYEQLGGKIVYRKRIKRILVEDNRAVGVRFDDGTVDYADIIISACDGRTVIYELLEGKYVSPTIDKLYREMNKEPYIFNPIVSVFLGVNRDFAKMPHSVTHVLSKAELARLPAPAMEGIVIQDRSQYGEGFAPPGKSVVSAWHSTHYDYWEKLYETPERYRAEKKRASDFLTQWLDARYPGVTEQVEVVDVSTPVTYRRYTGNHHGSIGCWKPFSAAEEISEKFGNGGMSLPGLRNFYMSGQWALVGGLIRAASAGRFAVQFACRDDRKRFVAHEN